MQDFSLKTGSPTAGLLLSTSSRMQFAPGRGANAQNRFNAEMYCLKQSAKCADASYTRHNTPGHTAAVPTTTQPSSTRGEALTANTLSCTQLNPTCTACVRQLCIQLHTASVTKGCSSSPAEPPVQQTCALCLLTPGNSTIKDVGLLKVLLLLARLLAASVRWLPVVNQHVLLLIAVSLQDMPARPAHAAQQSSTTPPHS